MLNLKFTLIFLLAFQFVHAQSYRIAVQPSGSKFWGFSDEKGQLIIPAKYLKFNDFSEDGFAPVMDNQKQFQFIDVAGNELKMPVTKFEIPSMLGMNMKGFEEGLANIIVNKKYGTVNTQGNWVHQATYDKIGPYSNGYAVAQIGTKHFILSKDGTASACPEEVIDVKEFQEGLSPFKSKNELFGFIDYKGKMVIPAKYLSVGYFSKGLAWVKTENQTIGFIDKQGNWVIQPQFEAAKEFDAEVGIAMVKKGEWQLINQTGNTISVSGATGFGEFHEGFGYAKQGNLVGFINAKGEWKIKAEFDKVERMYNGFANVKKGDLWGIIDKTGKPIVDIAYQGVNPLHGGLFAVKKGNLWGFIDRNGKTVIDFKYTGIRDFENGFAAVKSGDLWGLIDLTGKEILPPNFERVQDMIKTNR